MKNYLLKPIQTLFMVGVMVGLNSCGDDNADPTITDIQFQPTTVAANGAVKISVVAGDADNDEINYKYEATSGTIEFSGGPTAFWRAPSSAGSFPVTVTVNDGKGGTFTMNKQITVTAPVTQVSGYALFEAAPTDDLSGSMVTLYTNTAVLKTVATYGSGTGVAFNITDFDAGSYKISIWKDKDNSGTPTVGDSFGWYGTGTVHGQVMEVFQVAAGQTVFFKLKMYVAQ